nr:hypothetical protein [Tanacetum cinerariifolium]
ILEDKIICDLDKTLDLSQQSPQNCHKCGNPVYGLYCQGCALLREKFKEDLFAYAIKHGIIQDSSQPSNDNFNVVNAPREPFVVNQDLGNNSSQSPPQISNHYCCGCGNPLEGIFCHQCTCELCENGAHYGYNCPPKVPIIPDPEPFNNHTIKELPPTVQSYDPKSDFVHNSPNVFSPSLQPPCQPMNQNSYNFNSPGFDQPQPPQFPVIHQPPQEMSIQELEDLKQQYLNEMKRLINFEYRKEIKIVELKQNFNGMSIEINKNEKLQQLEQWANLRTYPSKRFNSFCYDDDDDEDYTIAVTPSLSTEEPNNSLSMGDEHLDTIPATESNEFIKYSVENLIPILSESEGILDNMCDVHFHDNSQPLDISKDQFEDFFDFNDEFSSTDDDSFSIDNIDYVEASPSDSGLVSLEVMEIVIPETKFSSTSLNSLLEETNTFDNSLPDFETFCFDVEEISSGSTTTHSDISLPEYEAFYDDMLKRLVVAVPLLILILLFMIRSSLIFRSTHFLSSIGVTFMSSPMNSFTSYLHQSMIVSFSRLNPTRGISHGCGGGYFSNKITKSSLCFSHPSYPPTESEVPTF